MKLSHIVAVGQNGVIGHQNTLPWQIDDELSRFKSLTMNKPVIMGRKTFESLPSSLPGRQVVVVSATLPQRSDVTVVPHIEAALSHLAGEPEVFIAGGGQIYEQTLDKITTIYYTHVHLSPQGTVYYPLEALKDFELVYEEHRQTNVAFTYRTYHKK